MEETFNRKAHWENIYQTKQTDEVSWYQPIPEISLSIFKDFKLSKTAKIIDVGGGESFLVDNLLELGYENVSVLDIAQTAIDKAKKRLGNKAESVKWITADIVAFSSQEKFDFWHDRAVFHFLTEEEEIKNYVQLTSNTIEKNGVLCIGTFSVDGPTKCSGIAIKQYDEESLSSLFSKNFELVKTLRNQHPTPFDTIQDFVFCCFRKKG